MGDGRLVEVAETELFVEERGPAGGFPLIVLHGDPGLDHHMFGDYLDPIAARDRYRLIRANGVEFCDRVGWEFQVRCCDVLAKMSPPILAEES